MSTNANATVEILVVHDGNSNSRLVSSVAKCPICTNTFKDHEIAVVVSELKKLVTVAMHRSCLEGLLERGPSEGVSDKQFDRYRNKIIKGLRSA